MYKQNKLGIYVYPHSISNINGISYSVNSIICNDVYSVRIIKKLPYGIRIIKTLKYVNLRTTTKS